MAGAKTGPLTQASTAADVKAALEALATVNTVDVVADATSARALWTVRFSAGQANAGEAQPLLVAHAGTLTYASASPVDRVLVLRTYAALAGNVRADINDLTHIAVALTHRTESAAVSETVEQQTLACDATGGSFRLKFMGVTTGAIAHNADQTTLQTALNAFAPLRTVTASLGACAQSCRATATAAWCSRSVAAH